MAKMEIIEIANCFVAFDAALSETRAVKLNVPVVEGVPLIVPFEAIESPGGSEPALIDQAYGGAPPEAVSVCE